MKIILGIIVALIFFKVLFDTSEPMTLQEKLDKAHQQYTAASAGQKGNRSSYLPRAGKIKADDYNNCKNQEFYREEDPHDFCAWHAEIGIWQQYGENFPAWRKDYDKRVGEQKRLLERSVKSTPKRSNTTKISECVKRPKYNPKLNEYSDRLFGDADCVVGNWMKNDFAVAGYWVEAGVLFVVIDNIRSGRDINLATYGFSEFAKKDLLERIANISSVDFVKRYHSDGSSKPLIEKRLSSAKSDEKPIDQKIKKPSSSESNSAAVKANHPWDKLRENMRMKEVQKILGKPSDKIKDEKNKKKETWVYKDGTRLTFEKKGFVHRLMKGVTTAPCKEDYGTPQKFGSFEQLKLIQDKINQSNCAFIQLTWRNKTAQAEIYQRTLVLDLQEGVMIRVRDRVQGMPASWEFWHGFDRTSVLQDDPSDGFDLPNYSSSLDKSKLTKKLNQALKNFL